MNSLLRIRRCFDDIERRDYRDRGARTEYFADALIRYVKLEYRQALDRFLPLAQGSDLVAQELIAFMYLRGEGIPADGVEAFRWFWLAANGGRTEAQYALGRSYRDGLGVPISNSAAVYWFSQAAHQGAPHAMNALGELYCGYLDHAPDYVAALAWFTKAAALGSAQAMLNIGFCMLRAAELIGVRSRHSNGSILQ